MFESNNKSIFIFTSPYSGHHNVTRKQFLPTDIESDTSLGKGKELAFFGRMMYSGQSGPKGTVFGYCHPQLNFF